MSMPDPPVPLDADLRDFEWMPVDVKRLRDSTLATKSAEVFRAAVLSWCVAWHQLPAGSLPACDRELSYLLGFGTDLRRWKRLRDAGALHGWSLCSDGRLYHSTVAEKVLDALKAQSKKVAESDRLRKYREQRRHGAENVHVRDAYANSTETGTRTSTETVRDAYSTCGPDQTGSDQEQKKDRTRAKGAKPPVEKPDKSTVHAEFAKLWEAYPEAARGDFISARGCFALAIDGKPKEGIPPATAEELHEGLKPWLKYWAERADPAFTPQLRNFIIRRDWARKPPPIPRNGTPFQQPLTADLPVSRSTQANLERHRARSRP